RRGDLRRGQRLPWRDRRLPRNPAPPGTARRHLVSRPERDAGTRTEAGDRAGVRGLSAPQRRRLRAREFRALACLSMGAKLKVVIAGLHPAIHPSSQKVSSKKMDARVKPAHDPPDKLLA